MNLDNLPVKDGEALESGFRVREYGEQAGDFQMVSEWWAAHTQDRVFVETILPPVGIIIERQGEPVAALWCHLSVSIGVAFLESPVTKPGLTLAETAAAMAVAIEAIERIAKANDYGILNAYTLPGIATWLERRMGFFRNGERVHMMKRID